jgi:hypothetical protein
MFFVEGVGKMTHRNPNAKIVGHLAKKSSFLLQSYHAECDKNAASRETEFWRGNLSGFRYAVEEIYGQDVLHEILEDVRKNTGLNIPPIGELDSTGKFLGTDSDADF